MWTTAVIETARLRLRAFVDSDEPLIAELIGSPQVRRFLGGPVAPETLATIDAAPVGEQYGVFCVVVAATDQTIGRVAFHQGHGEHELSYEFVPSAWGRGYATEAVGAVLGWIWSNHDHQSVIAVTQAANLGSRRLLDRLGFRFEHEFDEWGALQSQYRLGRPGDPS